MTTETEERELLVFIGRASKHFAEHREHSSFTDSEIEPGCFFGVRWGLGDDCVLVFKISEEFEPRIYQQCIKKAGAL